LTTSDWHHSINSFNTSHHGLIDGSTRKDTGGFQLRSPTFCGFDGTFAVNWIPESVDHSAQKSFTNRLSPHLSITELLVAAQTYDIDNLPLKTGYLRLEASE